MKHLIKKASKLRTRNIILIIVGIFIAAFVIYTVIFYSIKGWQWTIFFRTCWVRAVSSKPLPGF